MYTMYIVFCIWIFFLIYVKLKTPFWFHQPVYHFYQIYPRFAKTPYVIRTNLPRKNNYCDFKNIITNNDLSLATDLLQCHYLSTENVIFTINQKQLESQFVGQMHPSFVSYYYSLEYVQSEKKILHTSPVGVITSRATRLFHGNESVYLYFWDYICVHRDYKKKNLSRYLIQTHEYNQRHANREIMVSLFKKENILCEGVIPLVEYETVLFPYHDSRISKLPFRFFVKRISRENISKCADILENIRGMFDILVIPDVTVLTEMILSELWFVYYLVLLNQTMAVYVFKNATTSYDNIDGTIQCMASVRMDDLSKVVFFRGFLHALFEIAQGKMVFIENISHNNILLDKWREKYSARFSHPCAYYLYNYIIPGMTFPSDKVFILV